MRRYLLASGTYVSYAEVYTALLLWLYQTQIFSDTMFIQHCNEYKHHSSGILTTVHCNPSLPPWFRLFSVQSCIKTPVLASFFLKTKLLFYGYNSSSRMLKIPFTWSFHLNLHLDYESWHSPQSWRGGVSFSLHNTCSKTKMSSLDSICWELDQLDHYSHTHVLPIVTS